LPDLRSKRCVGRRRRGQSSRLPSLPAPLFPEPPSTQVRRRPGTSLTDAPEGRGAIQVLAPAKGERITFSQPLSPAASRTLHFSPPRLPRRLPTPELARTATSTQPLPRKRGEIGGGAVTLRQACPRDKPRAQLAFKNSMIRGILQFTLGIAFRCVLHRCKSRDIRC
jgi:hypothetical protein